MKKELIIVGIIAVVGSIFFFAFKNRKTSNNTVSKVDLEDGIYNSATILGYDVTVYKTDGSKYTFRNTVFGLRNVQPGASCTVEVKNGIPKVNVL